MEIEVTEFANGVDLGTERQGGVRDADLGNRGAVPRDGAKQGGGEGEGWEGVRDGWKWSSNLTAGDEGTGMGDAYLEPSPEARSPVCRAVLF